MTKLLPLTQGKFAILDDEDYELMKATKWCAYSTQLEAARAYDAAAIILFGNFARLNFQKDGSD